MKKFPYIIIGGGMAGDMAVRGIREHDEAAPIALFSTEAFPPYDRPPLSKGLWLSDETIEDIDRETADLGVEMFLDTKVVKIERDNRLIITEAGDTFEYGKLLLATGGYPRRFQPDCPGVLYYRGRADYEALSAATREKRKIAVIGGGYIGSEIAAALATNGHEVTMFFPESGLLGRILPADISQFVSTEFKKRGVDLRPGSFVKSINRSDTFQIQTESGGAFESDVVIAGLGIIPHIELARDAGIVTSDGIEVNEFMQTSDPNIFAAGDVASVYSPALGMRRRVEHEQNANRTGKTAGVAMAGAPKSIGDFLPMFYSDAFDLSWEGVGEASAAMDHHVVWEEPFKKGAIYYLADGYLRGAVMWNQWNKLGEIRKLIRSGQPFTPPQ